MRFAKLHGAGNDFILLDGGEMGLDRTRLAALVPALCHRRLGIGADGVLLVEAVGEREVRLDYWNSDGSEAAFCGNGTRCAARFAAVRWGWREMVLRTGFAAVPAEVEGRRVALLLPAPTGATPARELALPEGGRARVHYLVVGVPHVVVRVDREDFWRLPLDPLAPHLRRHQDLPPGGANVNLVRPRPPSRLDARFWERGVEGETLASGSGVVASALVAAGEGWVEAPVEVGTASGRTLRVEMRGTPPLCPVRAWGPAEWVAEGEVAEELLSAAAPPADPQSEPGSRLG
jgi:diaminopimelate epimerase